METKVKIKSLVSNRIILNVPEQRLKRVWDRKGAIQSVPFDQLEEAMYSPGVQTLFTDGLLGIDDMEVKIALGLEPEGAQAPVNIIILTDEQRQRYLKNLPITEFKAKLKELPDGQILELASYAIEHKIMDYEKSDVIKAYTGVDIMSAIKLNRDDEVTIKEK